MTEREIQVLIALIERKVTEYYRQIEDIREKLTNEPDIKVYAKNKKQVDKYYARVDELYQIGAKIKSL